MGVRGLRTSDGHFDLVAEGKAHALGEGQDMRKVVVVVEVKVVLEVVEETSSVGEFVLLAMEFSEVVARVEKEGYCLM